MTDRLSHDVCVTSQGLRRQGGSLLTLVRAVTRNLSIDAPASCERDVGKGRGKGWKSPEGTYWGVSPNECGKVGGISTLIEPTAEGTMCGHGRAAVHWGPGQRAQGQGSRSGGALGGGPTVQPTWCAVTARETQEG